MVSTSHLLAFALTSLILIAVPGPSVLFTISRALSTGWRTALLTVVGNSIGVYAQVVAVAIGIGTLVSRSVQAFAVIKLMGAAYLIYLGVQAIRHRHGLNVSATRQSTAAPARRAVLDGFVVGVANPKTVIFFVVALPHFIDPGAGELPIQLLVVGALFPAIALLSNSAWAFVAGTARNWFGRRPQRLAAIGGAGGLVMIGIGASLAISGHGD